MPPRHADFWDTKNAGINNGMLFSAWGMAGIIGPRIAGGLFDKYKNYQTAFYTSRGLVAERRCSSAHKIHPMRIN